MERGVSVGEKSWQELFSGGKAKKKRCTRRESVR
jgi:hypothetical protein